MLFLCFQCAVSGTIITQFVDAFATYDWQIYVGGLPGILGVCITTLARSMMTKLVGPLEIGKVLAMNGCIQVQLRDTKNDFIFNFNFDVKMKNL